MAQTGSHVTNRSQYESITFQIIPCPASYRSKTQRLDRELQSQASICGPDPILWGQTFTLKSKVGTVSTLDTGNWNLINYTGYVSPFSDPGSFKGPSSVLEMDILLECLYSGKSTQCSFQDPSLVANHPRPSHALSRLKAGGRDDCICGVGCQVSPPRLPGRRKLQNNQTLHSIVNFLLQVYFLPGLRFEV